MAENRVLAAQVQVLQSSGAAGGDNIHRWLQTECERLEAENHCT
jgi:hypothetical protein